MAYLASWILNMAFFPAPIKLVIKDTRNDRIRIAHYYSLALSCNRPRTVLEKQCHCSPFPDNTNTETSVKICFLFVFCPYGISHGECIVELLCLKPLGIVLCLSIFQNVVLRSLRRTEPEQR